MECSDMIFCHFWPFLPFYPAIDQKKLRFGEIVKNDWGYYPLGHSTPNDANFF